MVPKRRIVEFLAILLALSLPARAEEAGNPVEAPVVRCEKAIFRRPMVLELITPSILEAAPPSRLAFWNDLLPALADSLNQRHDDANRRFADLLAKYPGAAIGDLNHVFLMRLRGVALGKSGRYAEAVRAYDNLLTLHGDDDAPPVRRQVAYAMNHRAWTLGEAGDLEGQMRAYDSLIDKFKKDADPILRNLAAASILLKGMSYDKEGYPDEARRAFQELAREFPQIAEGFPNKGDGRAVVDIASDFSLVNDNQTDEAIDTEPKEVKARRGQPAPPPSPEEAEAGRLLLKAMGLNDKGDPQALAIFDDLIANYRDSANPKLQSQAAHAMLGKAAFLEKRDGPAAAGAVFEDFAAWSLHLDSPEIQSTLALGLFAQGTARGRAGDRRGAIAAYDTVRKRFGDMDNDSVQQMVATALLMKARTLDELGEAEAAYAAVDELIATYGGHPFFGARQAAENGEPLRKKLARELGKSK